MRITIASFEGIKNQKPVKYGSNRNENEIETIPMKERIK